MREVICPIDGRPCDPACKERFEDVPEGGCLLTMAMERGYNVLIMHELTARPKYDSAVVFRKEQTDE